MGTRGAWGYRLDNEDKLFYNHFDSYPSGLGTTIFEHAQNIGRQSDHGLQLFKERVRNLMVVTETTPPDEQVKTRAQDMGVFDRSVGGENAFWYQVTRGCQGNPDLTLQLGAGYGAEDFLQDSLFCEYAYIINLDENTLELYKGFNTSPEGRGRYAPHKGTDPNYPGAKQYWGVDLVGTQPLNAISPDWSDAFRNSEDEDDLDEIQEAQDAA